MTADTSAAVLNLCSQWPLACTCNTNSKSLHIVLRQVQLSRPDAAVLHGLWERTRLSFYRFCIASQQSCKPRRYIQPSFSGVPNVSKAQGVHQGADTSGESMQPCKCLLYAGSCRPQQPCTALHFGYYIVMPSLTESE